MITRTEHSIVPSISTTLKTRRTRRLLLVNLVLLAAVALIGFSPTVQAQLGLRTHYLMVSGQGAVKQSDRVWVLDTRSGELATMRWLDGGVGFRSTAHRVVQQDIENILKNR